MIQTHWGAQHTASPRPVHERPTCVTWPPLVCRGVNNSQVQAEQPPQCNQNCVCHDETAAINLVLLTQVDAFLRLGRCEEAFAIARKADSRADVQRVMAGAGRRADTDVVAMCTAYLQGQQ